MHQWIKKKEKKKTASINSIGMRFIITKAIELFEIFHFIWTQRLCALFMCNSQLFEKIHYEFFDFIIIYRLKLHFVGGNDCFENLNGQSRNSKPHLLLIPLFSKSFGHQLFTIHIISVTRNSISRTKQKWGKKKNIWKQATHHWNMTNEP